MCSFFAEPMALRRAAAHVAKVSLIGRFPPELSGCRARSSFPEVSSSLLQLSRAFGRALDLSSSFPSLTLSIAQVLSLSPFFFSGSLFSLALCLYIFTTGFLMDVRKPILGSVSFPSAVPSNPPKGSEAEYSAPKRAEQPAGRVQVAEELQRRNDREETFSAPLARGLRVIIMYFSRRESKYFSRQPSTSGPRLHCCLHSWLHSFAAQPAAQGAARQWQQR